LKEWADFHKMIYGFLSLVLLIAITRALRVLSGTGKTVTMQQLFRNDLPCSIKDCTADLEATVASLESELKEMTCTVSLKEETIGDFERENEKLRSEVRSLLDEIRDLKELFKKQKCDLEFEKEQLGTALKEEAEGREHFQGISESRKEKLRTLKTQLAQATEQREFFRVLSDTFKDAMRRVGSKYDLLLKERNSIYWSLREETDALWNLQQRYKELEYYAACFIPCFYYYQPDPQNSYYY
jgi:DNA repair exonuclease SbcCD ATPase subunit